MKRSSLSGVFVDLLFVLGFGVFLVGLFLCVVLVLFGISFVLLELSIVFSCSPLFPPNQLVQHKTAWFGAFFLSVPHVPIQPYLSQHPVSWLPFQPVVGWSLPSSPWIYVQRKELKEVWRREQPCQLSQLSSSSNSLNDSDVFIHCFKSAVLWKLLLDSSLTFQDQLDCEFWVKLLETEIQETLLWKIIFVSLFWQAENSKCLIHRWVSLGHVRYFSGRTVPAACPVIFILIHSEGLGVSVLSIWEHSTLQPVGTASPAAW